MSEMELKYAVALAKEQAMLSSEQYRRIVACVNYCEGVSTGEIEAAPDNLKLRGVLDLIDRFTLALAKKESA